MSAPAAQASQGPARCAARVIASLASWLLLAPLIAGRALADTQVVPVRVIEIAGGRAYLSAGSSEGLHVGTLVRWGKLQRRVQRVTRSYAVVSARRLRVGAQGVAFAHPRAATEQRLPKPRALAAFARAWPATVLPAATRRARAVPLGRMQGRDGAVAGTLSAGGAALLPLDRATDPVARAELRARLRATPSERFPATLTADVSLQRWFGRYTSGVARGDARPLLRVRELSLSLGERDGYRAQLGRLRYAASQLGPLDGGRFEAARFGPLRLAAFGGLLPDPIDGRLERAASRFGLELAANDAQHALRPEVNVVLAGSVFDGRLDERRLYARAQLSPGAQRLNGYAELSAFDRDNPFERPPFELTAAGADFDLRFSSLRLGGRFDMRKPERSRWLASVFPSTWLCSPSSALVPSVGCVARDDRRYVAQGFGGIELARAQLDFGGAWAGSSDAALGAHALGHATLRFPRLGGRYDLAIGGTHEGGTLVRRSSAGRVDLGAGWLDERVHLSVYYRPLYRLYRASLGGLWEHGAGASLHVAPHPSVALDLYGDVRFGDVDAAVVMLALLYRVGAGR